MSCKNIHRNDENTFFFTFRIILSKERIKFTVIGSAQMEPMFFYLHNTFLCDMRDCWVLRRLMTVRKKFLQTYSLVSFYFAESTGHWRYLFNDRPVDIPRDYTIKSFLI